VHSRPDPAGALDVRVEGGRTYRILIAFGYPCR
jgi:hypothetical protein